MAQATQRTATAIAAYLRDVRVQIGERLEGRAWTQAEMGNVLGVSKKTVSSWEQGERTPKQSDLDHAARALHLAELGHDPRAVRAPDLEVLRAQEIAPLPRGFHGHTGDRAPRQKRNTPGQGETLAG